MTALDIFTLLLVGGAGFFGFTRGFVAEALSLVAWVAAIAAVKLFHTPVAAMLTDPVGNSGGAAMLAFALVFGVTFLAGKLAAQHLGGATRRSALGGVDPQRPGSHQPSPRALMGHADASLRAHSDKVLGGGAPKTTVAGL